ncbi:alkaline phosphatase [Sphingomonas sp. SUN039]|uniref:alkaline phosphatase D family protein n=1 Tax=Sphingomonas sp. SUN039 TaxID=2937787 RepID=UPI002164B185|nr:alkaline phosphatase D family protein [Sphingomonas sp. SUN039]UVO55282.1 alkaline phosphatase D family protein [Sphingomonas sp. SUN039]
MIRIADQLIDRRQLFATAGFGIAGLILPGGAAMAQALLGLTGFTHNVASGEPGPDSVLLWTRYVPAAGGPAKVRVEISESRDFARVVGGGQMVTGPWRDHTVKITVDGLAPGKWHWYRFIGPDGAISPVGRTKTLPVGKTAKFDIAIFSCANLGYGEFNAYGHAAARDDIDLVLHMGDYFYEYARGGYDSGTKFAQRIFPAGEILNLADYRLRYASYRSDPQLQALHAAYPMIPNTDDHEGANDSWEGGAQNHQADEGDWTNRKLAAMQVWREWLPVGEQPWKTYEIGDLATYYRTDTRMIARSKPYDAGSFMRAADPAKAFAEFHDGPWRDPAMTMLGTEQESWLYHRFAQEKALWSVLGVGTNMGYNYLPETAMATISPDSPQRNRDYVKTGVTAAKAGLPYNFDNWGGYPAARSRLLGAAQRHGRDLVVVTGDSHNGWAYDLPEGGKPAGVEFGGHSVTSPGFEQSTKGIDPKTVAAALMNASNPELRWVDTSNRGYMRLSLTPQAATNEWVFMDTVLDLSRGTKESKRMRVRPGRRTLEAV